MTEQLSLTMVYVIYNICLDVDIVIFKFQLLLMTAVIIP